MQKLLVVLLALLLVTGCSTKEPEIIEEPVDGPITGGWTINDSLPEMNDMIFDQARQGLDGVSYSPLFILGTQVVSGTNYQYFCYSKVVVPGAAPSFKVVTVYNDLNKENKPTITNVADFDVMNYLNEKGSKTPTGLMGGWTETSELPNFLTEEENVIFEKAFAGLDGVGYTPIAKLASQVVAGTNYAFLAMAKTITAEPVTHLVVVNIYYDLEGVATINNICDIDLTTFTAK